MATGAGAYALGLRSGALPSSTGAPASESGRGATHQAPEARTERSLRRLRKPVVEASKDPDGAETRIGEALAALASSGTKERSQGLLALAKDDRSQAVTKARGFLDDPTMIRAAASVLLVGGGTPEEVGKEIPGVRAALHRSSCDEETKAAVTGMILQAANYANPASARGLAVELMASKSPEARRAATPLLQNLNADDAVPLLLAALDDPDPGARQAALATLRAFSHHDQGDSPDAWRAWWRAANRGR